MTNRQFSIQKNIDDTLEILQKIINKLEQYKIQYYLDFGTLLGAVREKGFIPWDNDVDISVINEQDYHKIPAILDSLKKEYNLRVNLFTFFSSRVHRKRKNRKIYKNSINFTDENNYQIAKIRNNKFWKFGRGNVNIDLFFKYEKDNFLYWYADGQSNKTSSDFLQNGLRKIQFYNLECSIPVDYNKYLTQLYGNWKTPDKNWTENESITQIGNS